MSTEQLRQLAARLLATSGRLAPGSERHHRYQMAAAAADDLAHWLDEIDDVLRRVPEVLDKEGSD